MTTINGTSVTSNETPADETPFQPTDSPALYLHHKKIVVTWEANSRQRYRGIEELAQSIKRSKGLITPLTVFESSPGVFTLNSGYRRYKALDFLNWEEPVPVIVMKYDTPAAAKAANVAENTAREGFTAYETAKALWELEERDGMKRARIAEIVGMGKANVGLYVRCFSKLHPTILAAWEADDKGILGFAMLGQWSALPHEEQMAKYAALVQENPAEDAGATEEEGSEEESSSGDETAAKRPTKAKILAKLKEIREMHEKAVESEPTAERTHFLHVQMQVLRWTLGDIAEF